MKASTYLASASLAGIVFSSPIDKRQQNLDNTILQFALTLEHLENVFYEGAITNFSAQDFADAGYGATYYQNLQYIAYDEQVHVQTLTAALQAAGQTPVAACTYSFPYTDVASFITLSSILEGVGTSAYLGGAPLITSKYYLTVAGSILATEALHTSYQRAAIGEVPMANPFETPLNPNPVYTLAAAFIVSCPASNPPLPFMAFPSLTATSGTCVAEGPSMKKRDSYHSYSSESMDSYSSTMDTYSSTMDSYSSTMDSHYSTMEPTMTSYMPSPSPTAGAGCALPSKVACAATPGSAYTFTAASDIPDGSYVTFASGLSVASVQGSIQGNVVVATIPAIAMGQTYVFITTVAETMSVPDADILFGPAIIEVAPPAPVIDFGLQ